VKHSRTPWYIEIGDDDIQTSVCGPIKARFRRTLGISGSERAANIEAMEDEAMANAHLIVAAPDLLEAAGWVDRYTSDMLRRGLTEIPDPAVRALTEAIAKAKGETEVHSG
jgi:hypothetical protein